MTPALQIIQDNPKAIALQPKELFAPAIIGLSSDGRLIYSEDKILVVLQDGKGLSYEDALDHYALMSINSSAGNGRYAPIIATQTV